MKALIIQFMKEDQEATGRLNQTQRDILGRMGYGHARKKFHAVSGTGGRVTRLGFRLNFAGCCLLCWT